MSLLQIIKLLDGKRSQAVGILISSLHLEMKDIQQGESKHLMICFKTKLFGSFFYRRILYYFWTPFISCLLNKAVLFSIKP